MVFENLVVVGAGPCISSEMSLWTQGEPQNSVLHHKNSLGSDALGWECLKWKK